MRELIISKIVHFCVTDRHYLPYNLIGSPHSDYNKWVESFDSMGMPDSNDPKIPLDELKERLEDLDDVSILKIYEHEFSYRSR